MDGINNRENKYDMNRYETKTYPLIKNNIYYGCLNSDLNENIKPFNSKYDEQGHSFILFCDWNGSFYESLIFFDTSSSVNLFDLLDVFREKLNISCGDSNHPKRLSGCDGYYQSDIQFDLSGGSFCSNIYIVTSKFSTFQTTINILSNYFNEIRLLTNNHYYTVKEIKLKECEKKYIYIN